MGPPGGPEDSWKIYNDSLILNFLPKIMDNFFDDADKNIQDGDKEMDLTLGKTSGWSIQHALYCIHGRARLSIVSSNVTTVPNGKY